MLPSTSSQSHKFRLRLGEQVSEEKELLVSENVEQEMAANNFKMGETDNIGLEEGRVTWDPVLCATGYNIAFIDLDTGEMIGKEKIILDYILFNLSAEERDVTENHAGLESIAHCREFSIYIVPFAGSGDNKETYSIIGLGEGRRKGI